MALEPVGELPRLGPAAFAPPRGLFGKVYNDLNTNARLACRTGGGAADKIATELPYSEGSAA